MIKEFVNPRRNEHPLSLPHTFQNHHLKPQGYGTSDNPQATLLRPLTMHGMHHTSAAINQSVRTTYLQEQKAR
jgi:hypothetical protein